jgi:hypothetical protein
VCSPTEKYDTLVQIATMVRGVLDMDTVEFDRSWEVAASLMAFSSHGTHPALSHSISQLLHAAKMKLQDTLSGGRCDRCRLRDMSALKYDSCRISTDVNQTEVKKNGIESVDARTTAHAC